MASVTKPVRVNKEMAQEALIIAATRKITLSELLGEAWAALKREDPNIERTLEAVARIRQEGRP